MFSPRKLYQIEIWNRSKYLHLGSCTRELPAWKLRQGWFQGKQRDLSWQRQWTWKDGISGQNQHFTKLSPEGWKGLQRWSGWAIPAIGKACQVSVEDQQTKNKEELFNLKKTPGWLKMSKKRKPRTNYFFKKDAWLVEDEQEDDHESVAGTNWNHETIASLQQNNGLPLSDSDVDVNSDQFVISLGNLISYGHLTWCSSFGSENRRPKKTRSAMRVTTQMTRMARPTLESSWRKKETNYVVTSLRWMARPTFESSWKRKENKIDVVTSLSWTSVST